MQIVLIKLLIWFYISLQPISKLNLTCNHNDSVNPNEVSTCPVIHHVRSGGHMASVNTSEQGQSTMGQLLDRIGFYFTDNCSVIYNKHAPQDPLYFHGLTIIPVRTSDNIHYKLWGEIIYPIANLNHATMKFGAWISNFIPHFTVYVITYPGIKINLSKKGAWNIFREISLISCWILFLNSSLIYVLILSLSHYT